VAEKNGQPVLTELARILSQYVSVLVTNKYGRTKDFDEIGTCLTLILGSGQRKKNPNVSLPFPGNGFNEWNSNMGNNNRDFIRQKFLAFTLCGLKIASSDLTLGNRDTVQAPRDDLAVPLPASLYCNRFWYVITSSM
jgi:hypothetical protein